MMQSIKRNMQPKADRPNTPALFKALGILLLAVAIFFIAPSVYEIQQATQASDWIPQTARVTHAEVAQYGGGRAHDLPRYAIDMRGTFLETNENFVVERIAFGQFSDLRQIRALISQYPPDSEMIVYSAPDNPSRVVLRKDANIMPMTLMICLGGACALFGGMAYLKGRKLREHTRGKS